MRNVAIQKIEKIKYAKLEKTMKVESQMMQDKMTFYA